MYPAIEKNVPLWVNKNGLRNLRNFLIAYKLGRRQEVLKIKLRKVLAQVFAVD